MEYGWFYSPVCDRVYWGGLGGYEISGVSSHSPLECGFGYSGLLHRRVSIQFVLLILIYVIFDVEVVLLSGLLCSWYSDIVGYKVLVYIGLTLWLETMLGKVMWFTWSLVQCIF